MITLDLYGLGPRLACLACVELDDGLPSAACAAASSKAGNEGGWVGQGGGQNAVKDTAWERGGG